MSARSTCLLVRRPISLMLGTGNFLAQGARRVARAAKASLRDAGMYVSQLVGI
jgi:hypothetical protein